VVITAMIEEEVIEGEENGYPTKDNEVQARHFPKQHAKEAAQHYETEQSENSILHLHPPIIEPARR